MAEETVFGSWHWKLRTLIPTTGEPVDRTVGSEAICSFDNETGFTIDASTVDELRSYTGMSRQEVTKNPC